MKDKMISFTSAQKCEQREFYEEEEVVLHHCVFVFFFFPSSR